MALVGISIVVWGHEPGQLFLLTIPSEAMDSKASCIAFSGRKLAKPGPSDGSSTHVGSGSSQGFVPRTPRGGSSCIDWINVTGLRECRRLYTYVVAQALLQILWKVGYFLSPPAGRMRLFIFFHCQGCSNIWSICRS